MIVMFFITFFCSISNVLKKARVNPVVFFSKI